MFITEASEVKLNVSDDNWNISDLEFLECEFHNF